MSDELPKDMIDGKGNTHRVVQYSDGDYCHCIRLRSGGPYGEQSWPEDYYMKTSDLYDPENAMDMFIQRISND